METTDRKNLATEQENINSAAIDNQPVSKILEIINSEDIFIAEKVKGALNEIGQTVELAAKAIQNGNRVFYIGSGTSGRLGILDASEMPPTYSVPSDWFNGLIAGGDNLIDFQEFKDQIEKNLKWIQVAPDVHVEHPISFLQKISSEVSKKEILTEREFMELFLSQCQEQRKSGQKPH